MKLDLAKDLHKDAWSRRDQLTSSVGTPIGVMTAIGGGVALMVRSFQFNTTAISVLFGTLIAVDVACLIGAAYFIARSYHGYSYQQIPNAKELDNYSVELHHYYTANGGTGGQAEADFERYLADRYVEAADHNSANNESKAAYLYRSTQFILAALIAAGLTVPPWAIVAMRDVPTSRSVRLEQPVSVQLVGGANMSDAKNRQLPQAPQSPTSPTAPKPDGPANRILREGEQPKVRHPGKVSDPISAPRSGQYER